MMYNNNNSVYGFMLPQSQDLRQPKTEQGSQGHHGDKEERS